MTSLSQKSINNSLTRANSAEISCFAMPDSDRIVAISVGTSGTLHEAPANGYFVLSSFGVAQGAFVGLSIKGKSGDLEDFKIATLSTSGTYGNPFLRVILPTKKGDKVAAYYGDVNLSNSSFFGFVYCEGEI